MRFFLSKEGNGCKEHGLEWKKVPKLAIFSSLLRHPRFWEIFFFTSCRCLFLSLSLSSFHAGFLEVPWNVFFFLSFSYSLESMNLCIHTDCTIQLSLGERVKESQEPTATHAHAHQTTSQPLFFTSITLLRRRWTVPRQLKNIITSSPPFLSVSDFSSVWFINVYSYLAPFQFSVTSSIQLACQHASHPASQTNSSLGHCSLVTTSFRLVEEDRKRKETKGDN